MKANSLTQGACSQSTDYIAVQLGRHTIFGTPAAYGSHAAAGAEVVISNQQRKLLPAVQLGRTELLGTPTGVKIHA
jgi:hypothetical protein